LLAAGLCLVMLRGIGLQSGREHLAPSPAQTAGRIGDSFGEASPAPESSLDAKQLEELQESAAKTRDGLRADLARSAPLPVAPNSPLIAHTAELAVATKEFAHSRTSLEEILERHRGYAAKLRMVGQKSRSVLSATLRIPSTELTGTVSELKSLGDVEREEQAADEITQQRADVEARLTNAQNTLRRLKELLQKQTYPDGNVRELQRQIANASAEVARIEAERQTSENRVVFANVYFTLREEVAAPVETLGAQWRGAAAAGFGEAMASVSGILIFLIGRGPVLLLWCVILYLPARWVWKRFQPAATQTAAAHAD